jgi:hypothetical protein
MMHWHKYASVALAVGLFAALPVSAQSGRRGGSAEGGSVEEIEAQLAKLRAITKSLEAKLASAKQQAKPAAKGEKGKHDGEGRHGFGRRGGPHHGFGHRGGAHHGFGHRGGPMHGFGHRGGWGGPMHGFAHRGPMHGPWGHMRGKGEEKGSKGEAGPKGKPGHKTPADLKGTTRGKEAPKGGASSGLEKKLDQLQRDLEEIRRELKRR